MTLLIITLKIKRSVMLAKLVCIKEPDYVMKILASWMTLDDLEGARTLKDFIDSSGMKDTNQFVYQQPFRIH